MIMATFTRASVAHKQDGSQVASGVPRYEAGQSSGQAIMVEEGTTNQITRSDDFGNGYWIKRGASTATQDGTTAPDGSLAWKIGGIVHDTSADLYCLTLALPTNTRFEPSVWIKRVSTSGVLRLLNPSGQSGNWNINLAMLGDGWERITRWHSAVAITAEFNTVALPQSGHFYHRLASTGDPLSFYLWRAQMEQKTYSTAGVYTAGTPGTREAELLSLPLSALPPQEFTIEFDLLVSAIAKRQGTGAYPVWLTLAADAAAHGGGRTEISLVQDDLSANVVLLGYRNGTSGGLSIPHAQLPNGWRRLALRRSGATLALFCDGALLVSAAPPMPDSFTALYPGAHPGFGGQVNTLFDRVRLFNRALTAAELRASFEGRL